MTLTKPGCLRIWDAGAYGKTKCISARFVALLLGRSFSHWGALRGRHWGFMQLPGFRHKASSPHSVGRWHLPLAAHTFLSSGPAASVHQGSWVAEYKSSSFEKMLLIRFYKASGARPCRGCIPLDRWHVITLHYDLVRVLGFRSFPSLRYCTAFPWPHRWPKSGQNSEQLAEVWASNLGAKRRHYDVYRKGLAPQGLRLCQVRMRQREWMYWWRASAVCDVSPEDLDPPPGTNIHFSTWMGKPQQIHQSSIYPVHIV